MVGLVLVAHSDLLVRGLADVVTQVEPDIRLGLAGGTDDDQLGTSLEKVNAALAAADSGDGVVVLFDLGSAEMTAEAALEFLEDEQRRRIKVVDAPLVEGALVAASTAAGGADLETVAAALGSLARGRAEAAAGEPELERSIKAVLVNPLGLHARPAAQVVRAVRGLDASVRVERDDSGASASATSLLGLVSLGAQGGSTLKIRAGGPDAEQALTRIHRLVEEGFGESGDDRAPAETLAAAGPVAGAPGLAMAPATRIRFGEPRLAATGAADPATERERLAAARQQVRQQLHSSQRTTVDEIFAAQALVLDDPELEAATTSRLDAGASAERAWWESVTEQRDRIAALSAEVFAARAADIEDVGRRVLEALGVELATAQIPEGHIVLADDLTPAQMQALHAAGAAGAATRGGSPTAHMAIVARNLGLPLVLRLGDELDRVSDGEPIVLDADRGVIERGPSQTRQAEVRTRIQQREQDQRRKRALASTPVVRSDGQRIEIAANVASVQEAEQALRYGADGVGLLRTEFLFVGRTRLPDEDEQVEALGEIVAALRGKPAIIRTLDIGGDKSSPALDLDPQRNGFLGVRGLRLSLRRPALLLTQLRAILRVAADHPVRIMFPFVTTTGELELARQHLGRAQEGLRAGGVATGEPQGVGIMVEIPVAALNARNFLDQVDFFSVGTNDLAQYLAAAGRTVEEVAELATAAIPVIEDLIRNLCTVAAERDRWVGVCGELAGDPDVAERLVRAGVTELSMAPPAIPAVKERLLRVL